MVGSSLDIYSPLLLIWNYAWNLGQTGGVGGMEEGAHANVSNDTFTVYPDKKKRDELAGWITKGVACRDNVMLDGTGQQWLIAEVLLQVIKLSISPSNWVSLIAGLLTNGLDWNLVQYATTHH